MNHRFTEIEHSGFCIDSGQQLLVESNDSTSNDCRPKWDVTWMSVAKTIAERSYDSQLKVGAIIVSDDNTRVLSVGYNGNYAGGPNVRESEEAGMGGFLHAELNAIIKCDYNFNKNKVMYVTHSPCRMCCKAIVNAGISKVVYDIEYRDMSGIKEILLPSNIRVERFSSS